MSQYAYAQLFTYSKDGFRTAAFIGPDGRQEEWTAESYDTVHLNKAADDGWRVISVQANESDNSTYLLEKQVRSRPGF
ncbi:MULTISPECIES: hypothetical protein [Micromonospora]|uniref:DUF4177 domain-containing protein n=1 Tax=Micromonospora gifhornensis TaxID=84594 RepID=A0ABQ4IFH3_9ACTN|nr:MULTISPECIES: hypothetical protein [Micromonospora]PMR61559.1 hypothetical protein C1A38_08650 [Verrucosispora sp. ts21]GIJ16550.1 hypothetical protein Vgi01_32340 [Micromonospora gifhornensis]